VCKYTKIYQIDQMAIKYTNIFHCKSPLKKNVPKLGCLVWKYAIWQPWTRLDEYSSIGRNFAKDCYFENSISGQSWAMFIYSTVAIVIKIRLGYALAISNSSGHPSSQRKNLNNTFWIYRMMGWGEIRLNFTSLSVK
jgi:hypothetical protein